MLWSVSGFSGRKRSLALSSFKVEKERMVLLEKARGWYGAL